MTMSTQVLTNNMVYLKTLLIAHSLATNGMRLSRVSNLKKFVGPPEFSKYKQTGIPHMQIHIL